MSSTARPISLAHLTVLDTTPPELVTVAVRRVDLTARGSGSLLDFIDPARYTLLPNTAGCYSADEAVRTARLAAEAGLSTLVKLEVIGDQRTLFPDVEGLVEATRSLVKEGFTVLPYTSDDLVTAKKLRAAVAYVEHASVWNDLAVLAQTLRLLWGR